MKKLFLLFTCLGLTACDAWHSGNTGVTTLASSAVVSAQSLEAFETTVYAFGQNQGCVKCHGRSVNPQWLNPTIGTAYSFARPFVDFNDPTTSVIATNAGNNHCGDPVCADPANVAVMQDLLLQWATIERSLSEENNPPPSGGTTLPNPPVRTATMAIPASLPLITASRPAVIRFDLSALTPAVPALAGAILEISIQSYNSAQTTYKIFNPRIAGNTAAVLISGIHVYVRPASGAGLGSEDVNQGLGWANLNATAAPVALPVTLPTGPLTTATPLVNTSIGVDVQAVGADVITLGFSSIH
jgi:hypothetical protein